MQIHVADLRVDLDAFVQTGVGQGEQDVLIETERHVRQQRGSQLGAYR